jgi:asparagine synthase (glutamine-hydrolysing)
MCGIAGLLAGNALDPGLVERMIGPIAHRGPDDHGVWTDAAAGIGLGHRRLSIVDLSPAGHEPMHSASGRFVVTYNGEVYNHRELRRQLGEQGQVPEGGWRGHSDIETLLQAIECWGLERALEQAVGMFAFALWDRREHVLQLVRDRFGEKPLYYGWAGRDFIFGSELKALCAHPRFEAEISREALQLFTERMYVPAPLSIYRGVFKLSPGCILTVGEGAEPIQAPPEEVRAEGGIGLKRYWSYRDVLRDGIADPIVEESHAIAALDAALSRAIADQSVADVPVGAFLSGGIDSSTIVALYQRNSAQPVRTFSIGFEDSTYDESSFARSVAKQLRTVHHEQIVTARDARDVIPELPTIYDEPFADSSQIPTFLVSRLARTEVTVAITGDGGDELFGGYTRHLLAPAFWKRISRVPQPLRTLVGAPLSRLPMQYWAASGAKVRKGLRVSAAAHGLDDVYASFLDEWAFERSPVIGNRAREAAWDFEAGDDADDATRMMYCDAVSYLPDDILCKVDRASMAVSLETRVPFLDHRVAAVAAQIPTELKIRHGRGKHILRQLLFSLAPRELFERPKQGFGIPLGDWLKGPLRPWAEDLLAESRLRQEGWLDPRIVQQRWQDHLSGRRDSSYAMWAILMFQAWLRQGQASVSAAAA